VTIQPVYGRQSSFAVGTSETRDNISGIAKAVLIANLPSYGSDVLSEEKGFYHNIIKNDLRKFKGKYIVDNVAQVSNDTTIALGMYKLDRVTLAPKDKNNRETHIYYLKHNMEQAVILSEIVEQAKSLNPLDSASYSACKYVKLIQELLRYVRDTCPDIHKPSEKLVAITPINKKKTVRMTATNKVPLREPIPLEVVAQEFVVTKVYIRRPKVVQIVLWYLDSGFSKHMTRDRSQLTNFVHKFLGTVKFDNDQIAKIMGYDDYLIGNITIVRVYYVEGLGHNLFFVSQFCDSDLEVAFRKHTCFVHNLEGDDLLLGSQENNLYKLLMGDMMESSLICLFSKASKTKSWLWHRRLSHLNFGAISHLAKNGLVRDDYSRFTWVKFIASKDEDPNFIIKFLKMIQVRLNTPVRNILTYNGTEFVNQTLRSYYESVGISHETLVARSLQQNGVVKG
nr:integrase, catalytic region, zinc finger, CCHC-type, peptidase aspartic, catalytic [Tanacetum cinerariifolium]